MDNRRFNPVTKPDRKAVSLREGPPSKPFEKLAQSHIQRNNDVIIVVTEARVSTRDPGKSREQGNRIMTCGKSYGLIILIILGTVLCAYAPAMTGALMRSDDLYNLSFVRDHGPLAGFTNTNENGLWYGDHYYRPFFIVQTWTYYQLFGIHYAGYQLAQLLQHVLVAVLLYSVFCRMGIRTDQALTGALIFAVHPFCELVLWVTDTGVVTGILIVFMLYVFCTNKLHNPGFDLIIFAVLLLAFLNRENSMALGAAWIAYLGIAYRQRFLSTGRVIRLVLVSGLAGIGYFLARALALGTFLAPGNLGEKTYFFTERITNTGELEGLKRLTVSLYTVVAQMVATFFPIFSEFGGLSQHTLATIYCIFLVVLFMFVNELVLKWSSWSIRQRGIAGLILIVTTLEALIIWRLLGSWTLDIFVAALGSAAQTVLSVLILKELFFRKKTWSDEEVRLLAFAAVLIGVTAISAFVYFRYRTLYLPLFGWLILFTLAIKELNKRRPQGNLRILMRNLGLLLVISSGISLFLSLPVHESGKIPDDFVEWKLGVCNNQYVPLDFALGLAEQYGIETEAVMECRQESFLSPNLDDHNP